jgi:hypothetical protein
MKSKRDKKIDGGEQASGGISLKKETLVIMLLKNLFSIHIWFVILHFVKKIESNLL